VVNLVVATPHCVNLFNLRNLCPIFGCSFATLCPLWRSLHFLGFIVIVVIGDKKRLSF